MCHENKMGAAKNSTHIEQYKLSKDSGTAVEQGTEGTVTRPLFIIRPRNIGICNGYRDISLTGTKFLIAIYNIIKKTICYF